MMTLTVVTGALDAVGYLGLDRVFTGNMTGNVVILGMGIAAEEGLPVAGPLIALIGYVVGAAVAGRLIRRGERGWGPAVTATLGVNAALLAAVATALLLMPARRTIAGRNRRGGDDRRRDGRPGLGRPLPGGDRHDDGGGDLDHHLVRQRDAVRRRARLVHPPPVVGGRGDLRRARSSAA